MFKPADLPDTIPVFPLPGAVLLPRAQLPLQIFEPRYLAMLDDCLKTDHRLIGMIQPLASDDGADPKLHQIGCAGRVRTFAETDDGRYMISLNGVSRFRVVGLEDGFHPYKRARVDWTGFEADLGAAQSLTGFDRQAFFDLMERYFAERGLKTDWDAVRDADDELMINALAMLCPFEVEEKQALLEAPDLQDRLETLRALMSFVVHAGDGGGPLQ